MKSAAVAATTPFVKRRQTRSHEASNDRYFVIPMVVFAHAVGSPSDCNVELQIRSKREVMSASKLSVDTNYREERS